jgi:hypothetical protein
VNDLRAFGTSPRTVPSRTGAFGFPRSRICPSEVVPIHGRIVQTTAFGRFYIPDEIAPRLLIHDLVIGGRSYIHGDPITADHWALSQPDGPMNAFHATVTAGADVKVVVESLFDKPVCLTITAAVAVEL